MRMIINQPESQLKIIVQSLIKSTKELWSGRVKIQLKFLRVYNKMHYLLYLSCPLPQCQVLVQKVYKFK